MIDLCADTNVPASARGVLLKVVVGCTTREAAANSLLFADQNGAFPRVPVFCGNGLTNSIKAEFVGGMVVVPFQSDKRLSYELSPNSVSYGTLIGYFD